MTRVARLTELDRVGIEVATAVRPGGHVLQVTQGKGRTFDDAVKSALGEAAELAAAENVSAAQLEFHEGRAWVAAQVLGRRGETEWVPADAVFCGPWGSAWLGPSTSRWSTNGLAAHVTRAAAVEHAVLELIERDAVARALPRGWVPSVAVSRLLDFESDLTAQVTAHGFEVWAFDLSVGVVPVAAVLLFDLERGPVPLTAGYAARRTPRAAIEAALLEAAQSRLTEIHGARDDVTVGDRVAGDELRRALRTHRQRRRPARTLRHWPSASSRPVHALTDAALFAVDLASSPLHVVKVLSPDLQCSELL